MTNQIQYLNVFEVKVNDGIVLCCNPNPSKLVRPSFHFRILSLEKNNIRLQLYFVFAKFGEGAEAVMFLSRF